MSTRALDVVESKCTLEFGQKLKRVVTKPKQNIGEDYKTKYEQLMVHMEEVEKKHDVDMQVKFITPFFFG